ncbi:MULTISPECIES: HlyD family secretion protein [unclassified Agarivorans]|uniref:HlyD family secretion protein n=1 Tax=unclassified Agarivorans TaxID=2636026 RepID=UPI0010CE4541|nr:MULTISPECIES: biotin/lipoyl-binding protein [unclassified Agarivorans]MDO6687350.1 biotin/lipoyl-binding protein [Agarivorans sp. 3_MG-2023]MDO6717008.1 biotin/lipoyl-binding protein [Agarivorans sp. 2_MG-2023]MDO6765046.1 biotin/lipoyl-binding protein [Agarivorans sp. 1_MG-2023]GDY25664.1 multidrug transporter [Agarivorans sp. Toyoura001]
MKEIMLPYILICWILVKTGVIQWTLRNAVITVSIGVMLAAALFTAHRFWSPADLTDSTTVKAPHAVLSPLFGQEVEEVFVVHNQMVKKGDLIYTLKTEDTESQVIGLEAQKKAAEAEILALIYQINNDKKNLQRLENLSEFAQEYQRDDLRTKIEQTEANVLSVKAQMLSLDAQMTNANWQNERREIRAPFDGQLSITNIVNGTRVGNMHLYDTNKKFVEMRIADQTYRGIQVGQFAEFYVDAYPGEIFRGRVHSLTTGTGEARVSVINGSQQVRRHVGNNMGSHGRTIVIEFEEPEGYNVPIGATGSGWVSANKPHPALGFMDIIGGATVRLKAFKSYLSAI